LQTSGGRRALVDGAEAQKLAESRKLAKAWRLVAAESLIEASGRNLKADLN
jgi:hypothetical protein